MPASILKTDTETLKTFNKILFRSSAYAITAYFISIIFERCLILAGASISGYSFELTYNKIKIIAEPHEWDQEAVLLIYLVPFFIQAIVAILIYIRFDKMEIKAHYRRIFILWVMFFITYRLLGIFPSHIIFKTGIYYALHWLHLGILYKLLFGIISGILFFVAGYQVLKGILIFSGTYNNYIRKMGIPNLIFSSIVYPILSVCLVSSLFFLPDFAFEELSGMVITSILSIYLLFKLSNINPDLFSYKEKPQEKANPILLVGFTLVSVAALRILLGLGIISG